MKNQNKLRKLENKKTKLLGSIQLCEFHKKKLVRFIQELNTKYDNSLISYEQYYNKLNGTLKQRTPKQWIVYYNKCIGYYKDHLSICEKEIRKEGTNTKIIPVLVVLSIMILIGFGAFFFEPDVFMKQITGFAIEESNITELPSEENISIIENITETIPENITIEELIQEQAEINKAVKWKSKIKAISLEEAKKSLPKSHSLISSKEVSKELFEFEYETESPKVSEEEISTTRKKITVSGPEGINYKDVLAYTTLPTEASAERVKLYHLTGQGNKEINISKKDTNKNGLIDYIEWIIPLLNNQTYELIIEISKAEHLDENKQFISDIYEQVKILDSIWSEEISSEHYIRVTFMKNLSSSNDITIYPRIVSGNPIIEIYEANGNEIIAEFTNINNNQYNKVFLTNLQRSQDTFDLKIVGGSVEFDHIIDPITTIFSDDFETDLTKWDGNGATAWDLSTTQKYGGAKSVLASNGNEGDLITDDIDTSDATFINVSFWFMDDDLDSADIDLYFFDGSAYDVITESLESGVEDTWQFVSFTTSDSQYFKSNFRVRFNAVLGSGENFWVDDFVVNKTTPELDTEYPQFSNPTETPTDPATYSSGQAYEFNITITSTNGTAWIRFNNVNYSASNLTSSLFNRTITNLAAGTHYYNWSAYGNGTNKNFNMSDTYSYIINKAAPQGSISGTSSINYGIAGDVQGIESNNGDGDVSYKLFRGGVEVNNPDTTTLGAGAYNYIYNATGGQNYTDNSSIGTFELTVNQIASSVNLTLNNSQSNITITQGATINLNCSTITGDSSAYLALYRVGSLINNGTSPIGNTTTFNTIQAENITCYYQETQNYTTSSETWWVNVTEVVNQAPTITDISNIPAQSITEAGVNNIVFSVLASDTNGVSNLNDTSLNATFTKSGESMRFNSSCLWINDIDTTTANYSCSIGIWYWDSAGTWNVNASILDLNNLQSSPYNETFLLQETTAMVMSPTALTWATLYLGNTNQLSTNDPILINNTGNKDISSGNIRVKAYDIIGETNSAYNISVGNFSVNINDACEGTQMQENTAIGITSSILPAGNNTASQGQEQLYFCLEQVPLNIISQIYSTITNWIIDII